MVSFPFCRPRALFLPPHPSATIAITIIIIISSIIIIIFSVIISIIKIIIIIITITLLPLQQLLLPLLLLLLLLLHVVYSKILHIYSGTTVVVRCRDSINTTNMHFVVHPADNLTFSAKAVAMARDEVGDVLILYTIPTRAGSASFCSMYSEILLTSAMVPIYESSYCTESNPELLLCFVYDQSQHPLLLLPVITVTRHQLEHYIPGIGLYPLS